MKPLFSLFLLVFLVQISFSQDCLFEPPVSINSAIQEFEVLVPPLMNNDLGENPLLAINLSFEHSWAGDVAISLRSPGGIEYLIVGDDNNMIGGTGSSGGVFFDVQLQDFANQALTSGNPYQNTCGNSCFGNYNIYCPPYDGFPFYSDILEAGPAPNCSLFDFSVPGMPIEGIWTLRVACVGGVSFEQFTFHEASLFFDCGYTACFASGAGNYFSIEEKIYVTCNNSSFIIETDLPPSGSYSWQYAGQTIVTDEPELTITNADFSNIETILAFVPWFDNSWAVQTINVNTITCFDEVVELQDFTPDTLCFNQTISVDATCTDSLFYLALVEDFTCALVIPQDFGTRDFCFSYTSFGVEHESKIRLQFSDLAGVFPGDLNRDGRVDILDPIYTALSFGETGTNRTENEANWEWQAAANWQEEHHGLNHKHRDANGDGVVDFDDLEIIEYHWQAEHDYPYWTSTLEQINTNINAVPIRMNLSPLHDDGLHEIPVNIGNIENPVDGMTALAFAIHPPDSWLENEVVTFTFNEAWLSGQAADFLQYSYIEDNSIYIAIALPNHQSLTDFGTIGHFEVDLTDGTTYKAFNWEIEPLIGLDTDEKRIDLSALVYYEKWMNNTSNATAIPLNIAPNPAKETLFLTFQSDQNRMLTLYDAFGKAQIARSVFTQNTSLTLPSLPSGIYFLEVKENANRSVYKVLIK